MKILITIPLFILISACHSQITEKVENDCGVAVSYIPDISLQLTVTNDFSHKQILMSLPNESDYLDVSCNDQYDGPSEITPGVHCSYSHQTELDQNLTQFDLASMPMLGSETQTIRFIIIDQNNNLSQPIEKTVAVKSIAQVKKMNIDQCETRLIHVQYSGLIN